MFFVPSRAGGERQRTEDTTPAMALTTQILADLWHRRLGHINPHSMEFTPHEGRQRSRLHRHPLQAPFQTATSATSTKANRRPAKKTVRETSWPIKVVYTDLMGPMKPAAKGTKGTVWGVPPFSLPSLGHSREWRCHSLKNGFSVRCLRSLTKKSTRVHIVKPKNDKP